MPTMNNKLSSFPILLRQVLLGVAWFCAATAAIPRLEAGVLKSEVVISTGLSLPIYAAAPTGDFQHLYIAEGDSGLLKRLNLQTHALTTMLDLPNPILGVDSGFNGFAFHPNYATNGKIYVNLSGNNETEIKILEFTRSTSNPDVFDPATERRILTISNPSSDHSGGWIDFGPDGDLYVATGDGGNLPPQELKGLDAQDVTKLRGKVLRINVDGDDFPDDPLRNYAIPASNPFAGGGGAPEVFAYGLRHPFRNGFDRETGDLYIGDVGSHIYEEINFLPGGTNGGQNFGWRAREGFDDNFDFPDLAPANAIDPIHAHARGNGAAVIGGYVYRGTAIPWLEGTYLFGDFIQKKLLSLRYDGTTVSEFTDRAAELASPLGAYGGIASFAQDAAGELYLIDYIKGDVHRIVAAPPIEQGDYNQNGVVDAADYTVWRNAFGQNVTPRTLADGDGSGVIDQGDYNRWKSNFGLVTGSGGSGSSAAVPEPSALFLAVLGILAVCCFAYRARRLWHGSSCLTSVANC